MAKQSFTKLAGQIPDEASAYEYLEKLRWPSGVPTCPHCGNQGANFIKPRSGATRTTTRGTPSARRLWQCKKCRKQFSAMTGTIFHGSHVPLRTWLFVLFEMCASKNGMAAREIERKYGVAPKTAWFMSHRIREAMKRDSPDSLVGTIVADETWIGGEPRNRHGEAPHDRKRLDARTYEPITPGTKIRKTDKTPVLSLINAETGEVRSAVVPRVDGTNLRKVMAEQVDMGGSVLWTDDGSWYKAIGREFLDHEAVNHTEGEYVRGRVTTNRAEGYFAQLKRSLDGTHHKVSVEHLPRYLAEFDFRYTTSALSDERRLSRLMGQVEGRRLSYKRTKGA